MKASQYLEIAEGLTLKKYFVYASASPEITANADDLLGRVIGLLIDLDWKLPIVISSGHRPPLHNAAVGGAMNSYHLFGKGIDLLDLDQALCKAVEDNYELLHKHELWMENPKKTPTHAHFDTGIRPDREIRIFNI